MQVFDTDHLCEYNFGEHHSTYTSISPPVTSRSDLSPEHALRVSSPNGAQKPLLKPPLPPVTHAWLRCLIYTLRRISSLPSLYGIHPNSSRVIAHSAVRYRHTSKLGGVFHPRLVSFPQQNSFLLRLLYPMLR